MWTSNGGNAGYSIFKRDCCLIATCRFRDSTGGTLWRAMPASDPDHGARSLFAISSSLPAGVRCRTDTPIHSTIGNKALHHAQDSSCRCNPRCTLQRFQRECIHLLQQRIRYRLHRPPRNCGRHAGWRGRGGPEWRHPRLSARRPFLRLPSRFSLLLAQRRAHLPLNADGKHKP